MQCDADLGAGMHVVMNCSQHLCFLGQRAREAHALLLAPRQAPRGLVHEVLHAHSAQGLVHGIRDFLPAHAPPVLHSIARSVAQPAASSMHTKSSAGVHVEI